MPLSIAAPRLTDNASLLYWLFALHLLTVWGLALSNAFLGMMILAAIFFRRSLDWRWPHTAPILVPLGARRGASVLPITKKGLAVGPFLTSAIKGKQLFIPRYWKEFGYT